MVISDSCRMETSVLHLSSTIWNWGEVMEEKNPIQVAGRLFETLELLAKEGPLGLMEISSKLELNKSTVHRVLNSLIYMGYVRQNIKNGKYEMTFKIVDLANQVMRKVDLVNLTRPYLRKLMEVTQETVHLVEQDGTDAVYIDKVESFSNGIQMISRIGSRVPLYCSGVGKALTARMTEMEVKEIWDRSSIVKMTPHTITDYGEYLRELQITRQRGYAIDNEENEAGVRCVAASLNDHAEQIRYAFSISAPVSRMGEERIRELAKRILDTKEQIERELWP